MKTQSTCKWAIATGRSPIVICGNPATHFEPGGGPEFCRDHAQDYEDVFGERLIEFPIEENEKP